MRMRRAALWLVMTSACADDREAARLYGEQYCARFCADGGRFGRCEECDAGEGSGGGGGAAGGTAGGTAGSGGGVAGGGAAMPFAGNLTVTNLRGGGPHLDPDCFPMLLEAVDGGVALVGNDVVTFGYSPNDLFLYFNGACAGSYLDSNQPYTVTLPQQLSMRARRIGPITFGFSGTAFQGNAMTEYVTAQLVAGLGRIDAGTCTPLRVFALDGSSEARIDMLPASWAGIGIIANGTVVYDAGCGASPVLGATVSPSAALSVQSPRAGQSVRMGGQWLDFVDLAFDVPDGGGLPLGAACDAGVRCISRACGQSGCLCLPRLSACTPAIESQCCNGVCTDAGGCS